MRTIIVDTTSGAVLALDPPTDSDGQPILPAGVAAQAVEITDAEAAAFAQPGVFRYVNGALVVDPEPAPAPPSPEEVAAVQARRGAIATVLNNDSVLVTGKEAERDAWCAILGCQPLSTLDPPIPSTQPVTPADIVLVGA